MTRHGTWGRSPLLLMSLVDGHCVLPEPIGWLCLQLDFPPSVAKLSGCRRSNLEHIVSAPTLLSFRRHLKTCNSLSAYSTLADFVVWLNDLSCVPVYNRCLKRKWSVSEGLHNWASYSNRAVLRGQLVGGPATNMWRRKLICRPRQPGIFWHTGTGRQSCTHTHTHTHREREREREWVSERQSCSS